MGPKKRARTAKGKTSTTDDTISGGEALELKQALQAGEQFSDDTLLRLLKSARSCEGLYSKTCKGKGTNPNCLCNLIPALESYRRTGLWAKTSAAISNLGGDPSETKREDPNEPVGLRNLGNTCYANSVLQCLFFIEPFRAAVFAAAPPVSDDPVIRELRNLFVEMQHGCTDPLDPAPLVTALQLDHAVQQDGQEFLKLFLTLLEHRFAKQPSLANVIQGLFRGYSGYETICQTCLQPSGSSSRSDSFYEVDVPVRGFNSLQESLSSLLSKELLCGDNQFNCDTCGGKRDATRQLTLRELPPLLCLSLQRFVFDFTKLDRVKVTDKFSFPLQLESAALLESTTGVYDLHAILIHKGGSALHGHYVAHIKLDKNTSNPISSDNATINTDSNPPPSSSLAAAATVPEQAEGEWWRFDDERVNKMAKGPLSFPSDHGIAATTAGTAAAGGNTTKRGTGTTGKKKKGGKKKAKAVDTDDDGDTYGFTVDSDEDPEFDVNQEEGGSKLKKKGGKVGNVRGGRKKAAAARKKRPASDDDQDSVIDLEQEEQQGKGKKKERKTAAAQAEDGEVEQQQQQQLIDIDDQGLNKTDVPTDALSGREVVSANAYLLVYKLRGAELERVTLGENEAEWLSGSAARLQEVYDSKCAVHAATKSDLESRRQERQKEVRSIVEAAVAIPKDDPGRFLSSEWLSTWADADVVGDEQKESDQKGTAIGTSGVPPIDNSGLLCVHGKLDPQKVATSSRRVSSHAWADLRSRYKGGPELEPSDACPMCLEDMLTAISDQADTQDLREQYLAVAASRLAASTTTAGGTEDDEIEEESENDSNKDTKAAAGGSGRGKDLGQGGQPGFYVSKTWLAAWHKRNGRSMSITSPTSALTCPHGALAPESLTKQAKRIAIPSDFWAFLKRSWNASEVARLAKHSQQQQQNMNTTTDIVDDSIIIVEERNGKQEQPATTTSHIDIDGDIIIVDDDPALPAAAAAAAAAAEGVDHKQQDDSIKKDVDIKKGGKDTNKSSDIVVALDSSPPSSNAPLAHQQELERDELTAPLSTLDSLIEFPSNCEECSICEMELHHAVTVAQSLHSRRTEEKTLLAGLAGTVPLVQILPEEDYYLVPSSFMSQWRAYMSQSAKGGTAGVSSAADLLHPPDLVECMSGIACDCHVPPLLSFPPPPVVNRRGRWVVVYSELLESGGSLGGKFYSQQDVEIYEVLNSSNWSALSSLYAPTEQQAQQGGAGVQLALTGIKVKLQIVNEDTSRLEQKVDENAVITTDDKTEGAAGEAQQAQQQHEEVKKVGIEGSAVPMEVIDLLNPAAPSSDANAHEPQEQQRKRFSLNDDAPIRLSSPSPNPIENLASPVEDDQPNAKAKPKPNTAASRRRKNQAAPSNATTNKQERHQEDTIDDFDYTTNRPRLKSSQLRRSSGTAVLVTTPAVCDETVAARHAARKAAALTYVDEEVMVESVANEEEALVAFAAATEAGGGLLGVGGIAGTAGGAQPLGERKSKRARKGRAPLQVSSTTTLRLLRLKIYEALNIHPLNAKVYVRGVLLQGGDDVTLAECEIYPREEIKVVDTHEYDSDDVATLFGGTFFPSSTNDNANGKKKQRAAERGFTGTALVGGGFEGLTASGMTSSGLKERENEGSIDGEEGGKKGRIVEIQDDEDDDSPMSPATRAAVEAAMLDD